MSETYRPHLIGDLRALITSDDAEPGIGVADNCGPNVASINADGGMTMHLANFRYSACAVVRMQGAVGRHVNLLRACLS